MESFSRQLKMMRIEKNYTQKQMAEFLNIRQQSYLRYELGTGEPNLETLCRIAKLFDVTVGQLLGVEEY